MDIKREDIQIKGLDDKTMVSLKWLRGANRYNNGATRYGSKYQLRVAMGWASQAKSKFKPIYKK